MHWPQCNNTLQHPKGSPSPQGTSRALPTQRQEPVPGLYPFFSTIYLVGQTTLPAWPSDSLATNSFPLFIFWSYCSISTKSNWMYAVFEKWWFLVKKRNPSWVLFLLILWDGWFIKKAGNRCLLIKNIYTSIFHCLLF